MEGNLFSELEPGVDHIIPVADKRDLRLFRKQAVLAESKGVGHNLKKALEQAIATGLAPSDPHFSAVVTELSELYDGKQFQYFNRDTITMPGLDTCCRVTKTFLDDIRQSCDQERIAFLKTRFPPK